MTGYGVAVNATLAYNLTHGRLELPWEHTTFDSWTARTTNPLEHWLFFTAHSTPLATNSLLLFHNHWLAPVRAYVVVLMCTYLPLTLAPFQFHMHIPSRSLPMQARGGPMNHSLRCASSQRPLLRFDLRTANSCASFCVPDKPDRTDVPVLWSSRWKKV